jgi:Fic family protein
MFNPKYSINSQILNSISQIESSKAIIDASPIIPAYEKQFQEEAIVNAVHYGTKLEGNDLSFNQVAKVMEGKQVYAAKRDIQEVINYREVMDYLEALSQEKGSEEKLYEKQTLCSIHQKTVEGIVPEDQTGQFRNLQVTIRNSVTDEIFFRPPPPIEVEYLIEDFFKWLNSDAAKQTHPVLKAGITHYTLVAIHPFTEGNGRTARAMTTLVLMQENYNIKRLFALEEYFDRHAERYYNSLQAVSMQKGEITDRDQTPWLEFFTTALSTELKKIEEKVRHISSDISLKKKLGNKQIPINKRQVKLVEYMREYNALRMSDARDIVPMVSDDTIWRDLRKLIEAGIVEKKGSTKGAYYRLVS